MLYAQAEDIRQGITGHTTILTLSTTAPQDLYDVASCLCRVLLKNQRSEDVLTLDAILSTPLPLLAKRGFNVHRLLNQQQEEHLRLRAEAHKDREAKLAAATALAQQHAQQAKAPTVPHDTKPGSITTAAGKDVVPHVPPPPPTAPLQGGHDGIRPDIGIMSVLRRLGRGHGDGGIFNTQANATDGPKAHHGQGAGTGAGTGPAPPPQMTARPSDPAQIRNTARAAVGASKGGPGAQTVESTRRNTVVAPESQQQYCDPSAEANIRKAHSPGPMSCEIYLPIDQAGFEADQFVVSQRFISAILLPLANVFQLQPSVLRVFWDRQGPLIAFNRNGEMFCNARYYHAWRKSAVALL